MAQISALTRDQTTEEIDFFVAGVATPARDGARFESVDPSRGFAWANVAEASAEDVDAAVENAHDTFWSDAWRSISASKRGRLLMKLGDAIAANAEQLASVETRDNGKLYKEMVTQLRIVPDWLYYFGGAADKIAGCDDPARPAFDSQLHAARAATASSPSSRPGTHRPS